MLSETSTYIVIGLALLNAGLVFWVLIVVRPRAIGAGDSSLVLARFDGIDRNAEALRRELNQLAQALLAEVAKGARDGLAAAFDKVQEGSRAQAEQLAKIHDAITQFGGNVQTKLSRVGNPRRRWPRDPGAGHGRGDRPRQSGDRHLAEDFRRSAA